MRRVAIAGHSFGGITAMTYAGAEPATPVDGTVRACVAYVLKLRCVWRLVRECDVRGATCACRVRRLDPWLFPMSPEQRRRGIPNVPTLAMFGEYFTKWDQSTALAKGALVWRWCLIHAPAGARTAKLTPHRSPASAATMSLYRQAY